MKDLLQTKARQGMTIFMSTHLLSVAEEIAHRVGISTTYFGQVERGKRNVTVEVLGRVAEALGVRVERLLLRKSEENQSGK